MRKRKGKREVIYLVAVGLLILLILSVVHKYLESSANPVDLDIAESTSLVKISSAFVLGKVAHVNFVNESNIPVTLITTNISCKDDYQEEVVFGIEFDAEKKQYLPIKLEIGESKTLFKGISRDIGLDRFCQIRIKHWSKYGVEE